MKSDQIRETYLAFFEQRGHRRMPSASLVPSVHDPSVLLTTAGMQPFKPYFLGAEEPPASRLTSCQRCFRTTDIEQVGSTARHLTCFEMLGNFSFGDYFKEEAIPFGWELSTEGFGFDPESIWVTVFEGDDELGLGPDEESIEIWRAQGVPEERIVRLPRSENFWQAGPTGPCGPCSEMYLDRGPDFGGADDRPGDDTERFLEYWNHVFMSYELGEGGGLEPLPSRNIDTGLGLERMAAILQGVPSVFETDMFAPLVGLAEELSGRSYADGGATTRAMRILADHSRGMSFLITDGVVPSNEDRGYILRRIMRRAIQQGRVLELEAPYLGRFAERAIELLGPAYPELAAERETIMRWVDDEEESFGRTLDRGTELLRELIARARESGTEEISAADAFRLHDTYGFPIDLTRELVGEHGLRIEGGFEGLMEEQRRRARAGAGAQAGDGAFAEAAAFAREAAPSRFVGYEKLRAETSLIAVRSGNGTVLAKLEESPFYAEGGGQVSDGGTLRWADGEARVAGVYRVGEDDQALALEDEGGSLRAPEPGTAVEAEVDRFPRHATMRNHTATHLLHAALREQLGTHVRQAGSAVRPDKLRFDFTHGHALGDREVAGITDRVNEWIKEGHPVLPLQMSRQEAERLGAIALFGEKYGDWVRVIEVEGVSRELCGGTHVANTAEIGIFDIVSEGSSASNVRRIEAVTGPAAIDRFRQRSRDLEEVAARLGSPGDPIAGARRAAERIAELEQAAQKAGAAEASERAEDLLAAGEDVDGVTVVVEREEGADQQALLDLADRVRSRAGEAAIVLGGAGNGSVAIVGSFTPGAVERGLSAAAIVRDAASLVGGGGGGRDDVARAGGRDAAKLDDALAAARETIEATLRAG